MKKQSADWGDYVAYQLERLHGRDAEDAFHNLIEADPVIVPWLIGANRSGRWPRVQRALLEVLCEFRHPDIPLFLAARISEEAPEVWKQALNGLAALGTPEARRILLEAQEQIAQKQSSGDDKAAWITEAVEQAEQVNRARNIRRSGVVE